MGGNIPGGHFLGGNFQGRNFPEGSLIGGNFPGGSFYGGNFPRTKILQYSQESTCVGIFNTIAVLQPCDYIKK